MLYILVGLQLAYQLEWAKHTSLNLLQPLTLDSSSQQPLCSASTDLVDARTLLLWLIYKEAFPSPHNNLHILGICFQKLWGSWIHLTTVKIVVKWGSTQLNNLK